MRIIDSWINKEDGKTAIYCENINVSDISEKKSAIINKKAYHIIGYDILKSISGAINAMFLLDTKDAIPFPQEIVVE